MLEARNLTIKYGRRVAVAGLSLKLQSGKIIAIIGPNGAGKSSLLRALNGTVQAAAGDVLLDEQPVVTYSRRSLSRRIAVVAQEADLRFPITVLEFVLGGRYAWSSNSAWGWETVRDLEVVQQVLHETDLEELSHRFLNELSGGERQRAVLARALATEAGVLLLDEPTANLDLAHQAALLMLVRSRCDTRAASAVVVTHDINLAAEFANRIILMKEGRLIASGAPEEVLTPVLLREAFAVTVLVDGHPVTGVPRITPVHEMPR
ncbi:MAG TPA: ABC transporter ATP-binding protein [Pyrinomonadaceae bacterium]|nr:ABC transporter ATP-binding protein [Pyrinomonadaceae bacterium]